MLSGLHFQYQSWFQQDEQQGSAHGRIYSRESGERPGRHRDDPPEHRFVLVRQDILRNIQDLTTECDFPDGPMAANIPAPCLWLTAGTGLSSVTVSRFPIFNISRPQRSRHKHKSEAPFPAATARLPACQHATWIKLSLKHIASKRSGLHRSSATTHPSSVSKSGQGSLDAASIACCHHEYEIMDRFCEHEVPLTTNY
jgi:hypothetical protein